MVNNRRGSWGICILQGDGVETGDGNGALDMDIGEGLDRVGKFFFELWAGLEVLRAGKHRARMVSFVAAVCEQRQGGTAITMVGGDEKIE